VRCPPKWDSCLSSIYLASPLSTAHDFWKSFYSNSPASTPASCSCHRDGQQKPLMHPHSNSMEPCHTIRFMPVHGILPGGSSHSLTYDRSHLISSWTFASTRDTEIFRHFHDGASESSCPIDMQVILGYSSPVPDILPSLFPRSLVSTSSVRSSSCNAWVVKDTYSQVIIKYIYLQPILPPLLMLFSRGHHKVRSGVRIKAGALLRCTAVGVSTLTVMIRFEFLQLSNDDRMQSPKSINLGTYTCGVTNHHSYILTCLTRYGLSSPWMHVAPSVGEQMHWWAVFNADSVIRLATSLRNNRLLSLDGSYAIFTVYAC
jgi:hypothetical protein